MEALVTEDVLRSMRSCRLLHDKVTADELQEIAVSEGMSTLRMAAAKKVKEGITSCDEMIKVAYDYEAD